MYKRQGLELPQKVFEEKSNYTGVKEHSIHTLFSGEADIVWVESKLTDNAGNTTNLAKMSEAKVYVLKTDLRRALGTEAENFDVEESTGGKEVVVKGGDLLYLNVHAFGNPDYYEVTGTRVGDGHPLTNFNYTVKNTTSNGNPNGAVVSIGSTSRKHGVFSHFETAVVDEDRPKLLFVDVYQEPGEYDVKIVAYKNGRAIAVTESTQVNEYRISVGAESTVTELRTRLFFRLPRR